MKNLQWVDYEICFYVLADAMEKCCSSYFNPQWNMVRVTSCGIDCLAENVKIVSTADGLSIRVR